MRASPTITISGGTSSNIGGSGTRYNTTTGNAHNVPSSNGMCYVGGASNPAFTILVDAWL